MFQYADLIKYLNELVPTRRSN